MHSHGVLNKCTSKIVTNFNDNRPLVVHIMYVRWTTSLYCVGQGTWGTDTLCAWFSMKLEQVLNDTHNDNTLRFIHVLGKMTTVNTVAIHNGVIVMTEVLRCTVNIDNERDHGNSTTCVHFGVMYAREYDMCCKRWQWRALMFENGWYCNQFGWYCNIQQKKRMILDTVFLNGWYSKSIQNDIVGHCMILWNGKTNGWYCKFPFVLTSREFYACKDRISRFHKTERCVSSAENVLFAASTGLNKTTGTTIPPHWCDVQARSLRTILLTCIAWTCGLGLPGTWDDHF